MWVSAVLVVALGIAFLLGLALVAFWAGPAMAVVVVALAGFALLYGAVLAYGGGKGRLPTGRRKVPALRTR
jgi:hypothetical protein